MLEKGQVDQPWSAQGDLVDLYRIVRKTWKLKDSPKFQDRLRYLHSQGLIRGLQLQVDPELDETLKRWIQDEKQDIKVRKASLIFEWEENRKPLHEVLAAHSIELQIQLVDQIAQTPKLRKLLILDLRKIPGPGEFQNWYRPQIVARLFNDDEAIMRQAAVAAMKNLPLTDARPLIEKALRDPEREVRLRASGAMEILPLSDALELIRKALQDPELGYRSAAVAGVRFLPPADALPLLQSAMKDPEMEVRIVGFMAPIKFLPPEELPPLFQEALRDPAGEIRSAAGMAMKILPTYDQVRLIQEAFADSDWKVRLAAVPAVNHLRPSDAAPFIPRIRGWLTEGSLDADQKRVVARGLKDLGQLGQLTPSEANEVLRVMARQPGLIQEYLRPLLAVPTVAEHFLKDPETSVESKKAAARELKNYWLVDRVNPDPRLAKEALRLMVGEEYFDWDYAGPILEIRDENLLREGASLFTDGSLNEGQKKSLAKGFKWAARLVDLPDAAALEVLRVMAGDEYFARSYAAPILKNRDGNFIREVSSWLAHRSLTDGQKKSLVEGLNAAGTLDQLPDAAARDVLRLMAGEKYFDWKYVEPILKAKDANFAQKVGDSLLGSQLNLVRKKSLLDGMKRAGHLGSLSAKAARAALDITDGSLTGDLIATHPEAVAGYLENPNLKPEVRKKVEAAVKSKKWTFQREAKNAREAGQPDLNREAALSLIDRLNHCGEQLAK